MINKIKFFFTVIIPFFVQTSIFIKLCVFIWVTLSIVLIVNFVSFYLAREKNEIEISINYEKYIPGKHTILFPGLFNPKKLANLDKKGFLIIEVKNNTKQKVLENIKFRIKSKFLIYDVAQLYDEEDENNQLINYGKFKNTQKGVISIVTSGADLKIDSLLPSPENKVLFYVLVEKIVTPQRDAFDNAILFEGWYKSNTNGKIKNKHFKKMISVSGL